MLKQTPSQTIGPFFHYGLIHGNDHNLVNAQTKGKRIILTGQVLDGDGLPVSDAMLEIWQADAHGYFNHPADPNQANADPHFRGFGRAETDDEGRFTFKTIKPGAITDEQAPHINVRLFARGLLIHVVTRLYFADEARNESDPTLNAIASARRQTLIARHLQSSDLPTYHLDMLLQGDNETVFFDL